MKSTPQSTQENVRSTYVTMLLPGARSACCWVRPITEGYRGFAIAAGSQTGAAQPGAVSRSPGGAHRWSVRKTLHLASGGRVSGALQRRCGMPRARRRLPERDAQPVTMTGETRRGETGAMGAPGSLRVLQATGHPIDAAPGLSGRRASRVDAAARG